MKSKEEIELLDFEEHLQCHLYEAGKHPAIQYFASEREEKYFECKSPDRTKLIIVHKGACSISYGLYLDRRLAARDMLCIASAPSEVINIKLEAYSDVFLFNIKTLNFCSGFPVEKMYEGLPKHKNFSNCNFKILRTNNLIANFLRQLRVTMLDQLKCIFFFDLKSQELLYYLRAYYNKQELLMFFAPIASNNAEFSDIIYQNIERISKIQDVANLTGYSVSGVKKKYDKIFGMSFSEWIAREKSQKVYHIINCSNKTFKEIAQDMGFSSASHLDSFCKKQFGMAPGRLRKRTKEKNLHLAYNS